MVIVGGANAGWSMTAGLDRESDWSSDLLTEKVTVSRRLMNVKVRLQIKIQGKVDSPAG